MAWHWAGTTVYCRVGESHRSQLIARVGAGDPDQVPVFTVHVEPTTNNPDTVGATTLAGSADCILTVPIAPANAKPRVFVPAICTVMYFPTSLRVGAYVVLCAPSMARHPAGAVVNTVVTGESHCSQKIPSVGAGDPVQVPGLTVHCDPTTADPVTTGGFTILGKLD